MKIAILDFASGTLYVRDVPKKMQKKEAEDIADHFAIELDIKIKDCEWMVCPNMGISIEANDHDQN